MKLRDQCQHGRWDAHGIRPKRVRGRQIVDGGTRCEGGRAPTRAEWVEYGRAQGWIDYEEASYRFTRRFGGLPEDRSSDMFAKDITAIVDAALGSEATQ